jgi:hypothetical protein
MKQSDQIPPYYAPDGTSLGFRSLAAAKRLIAGGFVKASYGRKGHLKAIWLRREDGSNPVETRAPAGTRYSFLENLDHGRSWKLRRLDQKDEDASPSRRARSSLKQRKKQIGGRYLARIRGAFGKFRVPKHGGLQCVRNAGALK